MAEILQLMPPTNHHAEQPRNLRLVGREAQSTRVLIAHGDRLARAGLRALLALEQDIEVLETAADGEAALTLVRELRPDVAVLDMALPGLDAIELTRRIVSGCDAATQVLLLSGSADDQLLFAALRAGATGLLHDPGSDDVAHAIRAMATGGAALSPGVVSRVIAEIAAQPDPGRPGPQQLEELTAREREVMALIAMGLGTVQIAERLVVSRATVKTHVGRAMMKLNARDRAQLVRLAYETGLVVPRSSVERSVSAAG